MSKVQGLRRLDGYSLELLGDGAEVLINPDFAEIAKALSSARTWNGQTLTPVKPQAQLLGISRGAVYYHNARSPKPIWDIPGFGAPPEQRVGEAQASSA